jgi:hypothetical protein
LTEDVKDMEEVTFNGLTWVRKQEYIDLSRRLTEALSALNDEKAGRPLLAKATDKINRLEGELGAKDREIEVLKAMIPPKEESSIIQYKSV